MKVKRKKGKKAEREMEVMFIHDIPPLNMYPYDQLEVIHTLDIPDPTGRVTTTKRLFKCEPFKEPTTIDRIAIVGMSDGDLKALGMQTGLGVVLGEKIKA